MTNFPVSVQAEFMEDGRAVFRYDFSRAGAGWESLATNAVVGAFAGGCSETFDWSSLSPLPDRFELFFHALDPSDADEPDRDGDGISTFDEIFVHGTDPGNPDTDFDGLSDFEELIVLRTDPLDPRSLGSVHCDGFALALGGEDPLARPEGSDSTVWEHVFYSGTTNGTISLPQSTAEAGVLRISVSGAGAGELVVGGAVVPLVGEQEPVRGGDGASATNTLLLAVGRGVRVPVWFRKPDGLEVALSSADFLIGRLPSVPLQKGWIAFPHDDATIPCIHDLGTRARAVSLVHGEEFEGLTAEWECGSPDVSICGTGPVSAEIEGSFPSLSSRTVRYTLSHPDYICGIRTHVQTLRFCPRLAAGDEEALSGGAFGGGEAVDAPLETPLDDPGGEPPGEQGGGQSEAEAAEAFTNMVCGSLHPLPDALYLHGANSSALHLDVPGGEPVRCCPCPEHWASNYVAKAFSSARLAVSRASGGEFDVSREPCDVVVSGVSPSLGFADAPVLFATNGVPSASRAYTVLGVKVDSAPGRAGMSEYNALSETLGYPVSVCTNLDRADSVTLRTDALLTNGVFRLALEGAQGGVRLWLPGWRDGDGAWHGPELLLDGETRPVRHVPASRWLGVARRYGGSRTVEAKVTAPCEGGFTLRLEFAASDGERYVHDCAEQRITAVRPPLMADINHDGRADAEDALLCHAGRPAYFWKNDDKWKGDDAFASTGCANSSDWVVNGRCDLVNFLPVAVDVGRFVSYWGADAIDCRVESAPGALRCAKLALADVQWSEIGNSALGGDFDVHGNSLCEAPVAELGSGTNLPPSFVSLSQAGRGALLMEFPEEDRSGCLRLSIYSREGGACLYSYAMSLHIGNITNMVGWLNLRDVAGGSGGIPTRLDTPDLPEDAHGPGTVVFVHGYNMEDDFEAPLWAENVFKKLWWAGLDVGFVAAQWRGNEGQIPLSLPLVGYVTPNYYGNVRNAFATASALKSAMDGIQGPKWFIAHSLGNMLVSAAIQDHEMPHERFFMLNAAVAMEAYDPTFGISQESHDNMTPVAWTNYVDTVRATHWFELFPEGDGRRLLTWKGRFSNVTNIVNFYSTQEDVVCNGDGTPVPYGRLYAWYNQEYRKGSWAMMLHEYECGWEFNPYHDTVTGSWVGNDYVEHRHRMSPQDAANLTGETLRQHPFFLDFANPEIHTSSNGLIVASNYLYRAEMLAYAIPSESYAVGANPLPGRTPMTPQSPPNGLYYNHDMATLFTSGIGDLPSNGEDSSDKHRDWQHSTFVQRSYKRVNQLFKEIMKHIKESANE